jgi:O-antigen/teichoic acid export membrane protein
MLRKTIKELGTHSFIYLLGATAGALTSIVLLPIYTRFLSRSDYGILEIIDSARYLLIHILIAGFVPAMAKFYKEADTEKTQQEVIGTSSIFIFCSTSFWAICFFLFSKPIAQVLLGSTEFVGYVNLGILLIALEPILTTEYNYLNIRKQSKFFAVIKFSRLCVNIGLNIYFIVFLHFKAKGMLFGDSIASGILAIFLTTYLIQKNGLSFRLNLLGRMAKFGIPIVPNMLSAVLMQRADRYLIQKFTSLSDVGLYGIGYKFPAMLNFLILNSFSRIWSTAVMYEIAKQEHYQRTYAKVTTYFMTLYIICQYLVIVLAPTILKVLATPDYFEAWRIVQVVGLAYCVYALHYFFTVGAFIKSKTWYLPISYISSALINIGLNWYFLPRYGYMAGAWNIVITYFVFSFLNFFIFQKIYPIPFEFRRLGILFGSGIFLVLLSNALHMPNHMLEFAKEVIFAMIFPLILLFGPYFDRDEKDSLCEELHKIHPKLARAYARIASK